MTDNTQELDEILARFADGEYSKHWVDERKTYTKLEAKQAILDWHNKQVEEVLDRLEADVWRRMANTSVITIINDERKVIERIESDE